MNAKSEFIEIFPISIDRLTSKSIYKRDPEYNKIAAFDSLSEEQKRVVKNSPTLEEITYPFTPFYSKVDISGNSNYHNGRALTEQNISNIICKLTNKQSYVLGNIAGEEDAKYLEFIIKGHYFKLSDQDLLGNSNLYVGVNFINTSNNNFEQLDGYDHNFQETNVEGEPITVSRFTEVNFSTTELYTDTSKPNDYEGDIYDFVLPLIIESEVPTSSKFRFDGNSIENINGGTV